MRLNMCTGAEGNQAHHRDSNGPRVQKQPLFLVCSSIDILMAAMQTYLLQGAGDRQLPDQDG